MDWQNILMIAIAAVLLLVWVPALIFAVRKALRKEDRLSRPRRAFRHSRLDRESQTDNNKNE